MKHGNEIKNARSMGGYRLRVSFKDGYETDLDLEPLFENARGPLMDAFRNPEFFRQVSVDTDLGVVSWPNGYDICPDTLRFYCEMGRVTSREELNAFFNPEPAVIALHDKIKP